MYASGFMQNHEMHLLYIFVVPLSLTLISSSHFYPFISHLLPLKCVINRYISEFTETAGRPEFVDSDIPDQEIIGHPVQAFQLIKRLTVEWKDVKNIMGQASHSWESKFPQVLLFYLTKRGSSRES